MRQSCVLNAVLKKSTSGCAKNLLKLNRDKPELVVISSKFRNRPTIEYVRVGDEFIAPNLSVRNLGVIMDNCFCMEQRVKKKNVVRQIIISGIYQRSANISPRTLLKFSSMLLLALSLTIVTHFYIEWGAGMAQW